MLYYFPLHAIALSFNFTNINNTLLNINITANQPASINDQGIEVTPNDYETVQSGGASGKAFTPADGLTFFFLPYDNATSNITTGESNKKALIVELTASSFILVGGLALLGFVLWKKSSRSKQEAEFAIKLSMDNDFEAGTGPKKFSYGELFRATNYFADKQKLGEGGFGGVFKGFLRELDSYVAVKRISKGLKQGITEYASEVKIISRLRYRNLVQLLGWCHNKRELLLVYEFMENGRLDYHLFKEISLLTWAMRYKIAQGLASALLYLHEEWEQCVVHRDVKSSNVMLDSNFNAKLGDFGLARLVDHGKDSQTTILAGTRGYMASECLITGKANKESDVYSFGVVALEIACERKPIDLEVPKSQMRMVEWVWDLYGTNRLLETAIDPKICPNFVKEEMECLMIVGLWCAHPDHNLRPSIRQAIHVLNFESPLPILPAKMPVPTYLAPPVNGSSLGLLLFLIATKSSLQAIVTIHIPQSSPHHLRLLLHLHRFCIHEYIN
ncbi:hypothetical protein ACSBR2_021894 [Camellia fascicularis]